MKFNVTKHCRNRYIERVLGNSNSSNNILLVILNDLNKSVNVTSKISLEVPRFTLFLKEKYGSCNILKNNYTFFICKKRKNTLDLYDVVTCYIDKDDLKMFKGTVLSNDDIYLKLKLLKHEN